jgi:hypothetical protein
MRESNLLHLNFHFLFFNTLSTAFQLADKGYDVWLGNLRGSTYSNLHESLNVDMPEYWNFK